MNVFTNPEHYIVRKFNFAMALRWLIYLPIILPMCVVFGALQGMYTMTNKVLQRMRLDIEQVELADDVAEPTA